MGVVHSEGNSKAGAVMDSNTSETDVFQKRDSKWLLVSHTAWTRPQQANIAWSFNRFRYLSPRR
jgi:hypothetical protein